MERCSTGSATFTTLMSMKAMLEAMMVAAKTQAPRSGPLAVSLRSAATIRLILLPQFQAHHVDEGAQAGGNLPAAGIIQKISGKGRTPIGQHPLEPAGAEMRPGMTLEDDGQPRAIDRRTQHQFLIAQGQRPADLDLHGLARFLEFPAIE